MKNYKKKSTNTNFVYLLTIVGSIAPFVYFINVHLLLVIIVLELTLILCSKLTFDEKGLLLFLVLFSYYGIDVFGIKIYDVFLLIFFIIRSLKHKMRVSIYSYLTAIIFLSVILISSVRVTDTSRSIEIFRYFLCLITLFSFSHANDLTIKIFSFLKSIITGVILQTIVLYFLFSNNKVFPYYSTFYSVDFFSDLNEIRLSGFFSDPNKYFLFFLLIIIIIDIIMKLNADQFLETRKINSLYLLCILGAIISFSRTVILVIGFFIIIYLIGRKINNKKYVYFIIISATIFFILIFTLATNQVLSIINFIFNKSLVVLGRERTAALNNGIANDSRILIWKNASYYLSNHLWLGNGPLSFEYLGLKATHNTFLNLLLDYGIMGLFSYFILIKNFVLKLKPEFFISFIFIPMLFLDLGNYRLFFVVLGLLAINKDKIKKTRK